MKRKFSLLLLFIPFFHQTVFSKTQSAENTHSATAMVQDKSVPTGFIGQVLYISAADDTMIFVSSENIPAAIFISVFNAKTAKWSAPEQIVFSDEILKNKCPKVTAGKELFVALKNKKGKTDLYSFYYNNWKCSNLSKLNENINTGNNEKSACLSEDGNTLYFSSDRKGGKGGYDIYKSEKLENGGWGTAQNLGGIINTKSDEDTPFILSDNVTLYFSSKAHSSIGGYDIFSSTLSEEGIWTAPESAGTSINSKGDELCFYLTSNEKRGFYSSSDNSFSQTGLYIFESRNFQQELSIINQ
ncbi:MAG: hypothetical protein V1904_13160 [Bacteroidota bacterium]